MSQQYNNGRSNTASGWGHKRAPSAKQWDKFDALPRPLREALNHSKFKKNTDGVWDMWRGGVPIRKILAAIEAFDQRKCAEDERKVWGREPEVSLKDLGL